MSTQSNCQRHFYFKLFSFFKVGSIPGRVIPKKKKKKKKKKGNYPLPPCLTFNIIRYGSRVKSSHPGKGVAPSSTPWCSSYRKGNFGSPSTAVANSTLSLNNRFSLHTVKCQNSSILNYSV